MKRQIRELHERLTACLTKLNHIRPTELLKNIPIGENPSPCKELPELERTLELFHRLSRRNLSGLPFDLLRKVNANASTPLGQFRKINHLAEELPENLDQAMQSVIDDIKGSFDQVSANFARCHGWVHVSNSGNTDLTIALCILGVALGILAYFSTHDKAVADALLKAVHGIGLS